MLWKQNSYLQKRFRNKHISTLFEMSSQSESMQLCHTRASLGCQQCSHSGCGCWHLTSSHRKTLLGHRLEPLHRQHQRRWQQMAFLLQALKVSRTPPTPPETGSPLHRWALFREPGTDLSHCKTDIERNHCISSTWLCCKHFSWQWQCYRTYIWAGKYPNLCVFKKGTTFKSCLLIVRELLLLGKMWVLGVLWGLLEKKNWKEFFSPPPR